MSLPEQTQGGLVVDVQLKLTVVKLKPDMEWAINGNVGMEYNKHPDSTRRDVILSILPQEFIIQPLILWFFHWLARETWLEIDAKRITVFRGCCGSLVMFLGFPESLVAFWYLHFRVGHSTKLPLHIPNDATAMPKEGIPPRFRG